MLQKTHGDWIRDSLVAGNSVYLSFDFPDIPTDHNLDLKVWVSSNNKKSYQLLDHVNEALKLINSDYLLSLKFVIVERDLLADQQETDCVCKGTYCAPNVYDEPSIKVESVILEDLFQYCLYNNYPKQFFKYVAKFKQNCVNEKLINPSCRSQVVKNMDFKYSKVIL